MTKKSKTKKKNREERLKSGMQKSKKTKTKRWHSNTIKLFTCSHSTPPNILTQRHLGSILSNLLTYEASVFAKTETDNQKG